MIGDVWIRDPSAERFEYWGDRDKTEGAWREGAFTVGDLGYLDEDGYLFLVGRKHDVIISGGVNVYPPEVEAALAKHPDIAEVAVYGVDSDEWGEEVTASIVPRPDATVDSDELREWCRARLAGPKIPRHFTVVKELARTPTGKVRRTPP